MRRPRLVKLSTGARANKTRLHRTAGNPCAQHRSWRQLLLPPFFGVASRRAPLVTGEQGRRALALAQRITERMSTEQQR